MRATSPTPSRALRALLGVGVAAAVGVVSLLGGMALARSTAHTALHTPYTTHEVDFPAPFPLTAQEVDELRVERAAELGAEGEDDPLAGVDLDAVAHERAAVRGEHYAKVYLCTDCHGTDLAGGVMIDDAAMGTVLGPNVTPGSRTRDFTVADWDRAVRHGVNADGLGTLMPINDFAHMTDRELSDLIVYLRILPPSDAGQPRPQMGPVGTVLLATGGMVLEASLMDH